ncbi:MAG: CsbD family protein [Acidimicrobiales bacterium]
MTMKDKAKNLVEVSRGKLKEVTAEVVGNNDLLASGRNEQRLANLRQAGEKVKDALKKR